MIRTPKEKLQRMVRADCRIKHLSEEPNGNNINTHCHRNQACRRQPSPHALDFFIFVESDRNLISVTSVIAQQTQQGNNS